MVVKGRPGIRLQRQMARIVQGIEEKYEALERWDGLLNRLKGIEEFMEGMIKDPEVKKERGKLDLIDLTGDRRP